MRAGKMNRGESYLLSCEKDLCGIVEKLFVTGKNKEELTRLLVINTPDCLDNTTNSAYLEKIKEMTPKKMRDEKYICFEPRVTMAENEEIKSRLIISFDKFYPNPTNPYYMDAGIVIDILCHHETWDIGNYRLRPIKIAGYVNNILNNTRLSGLGTLTFNGMSELILNENLSGYTLFYSATHGADDVLEEDEED